jgi:hypothetical protein
MQKFLFVVIALILGAGGGFLGGMKYQKSRCPSFFTGGDFQNMGKLSGQGQQNGMQAFGGTNGRGNFISGEIFSLDSGSLTVKLLDGSSKIIFFSDSTQIQKMSTTSAQVLKTGDSVMITGKTNDDGSVTAQSIQLR